MSPRCERCEGPLVPVEYGMPVGDEPYRRHERREIYFTGGCMGGPEPWWCWSCERFADPEPRPPRSMTLEGYQLSVLDDMRGVAPESLPELPAPYDDPPAGLVEEAGRWRVMQSPKIVDLAAILGGPVSGGPSRHRFALPLWPGFWLEHTSLDTEAGEYVLDRRFVRRSGEPMRSADDLRPWSVLRPEAEAFFGWEPTRSPNAYYHVVPFRLGGRPMEACFVHDLLLQVSERSEG
ncbi:hypothetical protein SAMN06265355_12315 [Actinomadura mexicana]|uniref:Uncharacterized protein n=2 Tax=Actinomadura mexicana TaxID=134959 RepID=A0A239G7K2_9ACTN|nr:hypothetical protein SAMN06265355_12315 [Actinomadura mexicana]